MESTHLKRNELVVDAANVQDSHAKAQHLVQRGEIHLADQTLGV